MTDTYKHTGDYESRADSPSATNGTGTVPLTEPAECRACGHTGDPIGKGQCAECKCWLPRNNGAVTHGLRRYEETGVLPPDLRSHLDEFEAAVVADLGGKAELSSIERGLVSSLVGLEAAKLLQLDFAIRSGAETKRGREALSDFRATADSYARMAKTIGMKRRQRQVNSLSDALASAPVVGGDRG